VSVALLLASALGIQVAVAQSATQSTSKIVTQPVQTTSGNVVNQTTNTTTTTTTSYGDTSWQGLNWGIGIAANFNLGGNLVTGAEIDNGIVRVTDSSSNVGIGFVLEAHYFFKEWAPLADCLGYNCNDIATGPFVAIEVGNGATASPSNGPITGYALGWMVGLHHPDATSAQSNNSSWNFGLGLIVNPTAQVLGPGFAPNQPPPAGETAVRYETEPRYGLMLLSSFSF
jgi:hypothetical protein